MAEDGPPRSPRPPEGSVPGGSARDEQLGRSGRGGRAANIIESTQTEWTDEKHSLYLNFIEESFVRKFLSTDCLSSDPLLQILRTQGNPRSLESNQNNLHPPESVNHRTGSCRKITLEGSGNQNKTKKEPCVYPEIPLNQHFKPSSSGCLRNEATECRAVSISTSLPMLTNTYYQETLHSSAEVSDQNFVDNDHQEEKQPHVTNSDNRLGKDQVQSSTDCDLDRKDASS